MHKHLILIAVFLSACEDKPASIVESGSIKVNASRESYPYLSPEDFGIQKNRLSITPQSGQVAVLRYVRENNKEEHDQFIFDQIKWTNGEQVHWDVIEAPLSFYNGYQVVGESREEQFRDSWRLKAGYLSEVIIDYHFLESSWSSSEVEVIGRMAYSKNTVTKSEDLVCHFRLFVLSLEEAKKLHPELDVERDEGVRQWSAAFTLTAEELAERSQLLSVTD